MPQFTEIVSELERVFPKRLQEDYDNAGVQVFAGDGQITQCLVTLDVTEEVVDEAIALGCNLIVAHHPLIFGRGLLNITPETFVGRIVLKAVKNGVSMEPSLSKNGMNFEGGKKFRFHILRAYKRRCNAPRNGWCYV